MEIITIYWIGVGVAILTSLISLTFTKDTECNIKEIVCAFIAIIVSFLSWLAVLIYILAEIRDRYIKE